MSGAARHSSTATPIPPHLRARPADVVPLAWTAAHAFAVGAVPRREGLLGGLLRVLGALWIAPRLIAYFPVVAAGVSMGSVARVDRHALLLVMPDGSQWRAGRVLAAAGVLVIALAQVVLVLLALVLTAPTWILYAALLLPVWLDVGGLLWRNRHRRAQLKALEHRQRTLESQGVAVHQLAMFAAHPRGRGDRRSGRPASPRHGDRLVRQLLPHVPPTHKLLVLAVNQATANHYVTQYGFTRPALEHPLLLER